MLAMMFSYSSSKITALATETPSLVIPYPPINAGITTVLPPTPKVSLTASATILIPFLIDSLAFSPTCII